MCLLLNILYVIPCSCLLNYTSCIILLHFISEMFNSRNIPLVTALLVCVSGICPSTSFSGLWYTYEYKLLSGF